MCKLLSSMYMALGGLWSESDHSGRYRFCHIVAGAYTPVLAKHSKHFSLEDSLAVGVDRMQRNLGPLQQQVEEWHAVVNGCSKAADLATLSRIALSRTFSQF